MLESIQYFSILIVLGSIPSIIWLLYYLRKDDHKEPKKVLLQVFFLGAASTFFALIVEALFLKALLFFGIECKDCSEFIPDFLGAVNFQLLSVVSFTIFLGLAFIEEFSKYLFVKIRVIKDKAFDEPVDAMIYLVVGALGFAAAENIGYIATSDPNDIIGILYFRFFTATFLHVLASAIVGYFFALSIIHKKSHFVYLTIGLIIATIIHGQFNILVTLMETWNMAVLYLVLLLVFLSQVVSYLFYRIKKVHYNLQRSNKKYGRHRILF